MPLNPFENMPASLWRHAVTVDKFFENFNELKMNGQVKEFVKFSPGDNLDNVDGLSHSSPAHSASTLLKQAKAWAFSPYFFILKNRIKVHNT